MTVNEFIKKIKESFGKDVTYRATSKDGIVFKSKGYDDEIHTNKK